MNIFTIVVIFFVLGFAFVLFLIKVFMPTPEERRAAMLKEYAEITPEVEVTFTGEDIRNLEVVQHKPKAGSIDRTQTILAQMEYCIKHNKYVRYSFWPYQSDYHGFGIAMDSYESFMRTDSLFCGCCYCLNSGDGVILIGIEGNRRKKQFTLEGYSRRFDEVMKDIPFKFTDKRKQPLDLSEYFPVMKVYQLLGKDVLAIEVKQVPEHLKYILYKGNAYTSNPD